MILGHSSISLREVSATAELKTKTIILHEPFELDDVTLNVMHDCALRFDGCEWLQAQSGDP